MIEQAFWLKIFHTFPLLRWERMHFSPLWWVAAAAYAGPWPTVRGRGDVPPSWRAFTYWRERHLSFQIVPLLPEREMSTDTQSFLEYLFPSRIKQGILLLMCLNTNPRSRFIMACMRVSSPASGAIVGRDLGGGGWAARTRAFGRGPARLLGLRQEKINETNICIHIMDNKY